MSDPELRADACYHLATEAEWEAHRAAGRIAPPSLAAEGFVHCSWGHQVPATVGRHFAGVAGLLALELDLGALEGAALVEEDTAGVGQTFPHVYGPIPVAAVVATVPVA